MKNLPFSFERMWDITYTPAHTRPPVSNSISRVCTPQPKSKSKSKPLQSLQSLKIKLKQQELEEKKQSRKHYYLMLEEAKVNKLIIAQQKLEAKRLKLEETKLKEQYKAEKLLIRKEELLLKQQQREDKQKAKLLQLKEKQQQKENKEKAKLLQHEEKDQSEHLKNEIKWCNDLVEKVDRIHKSLTKDLHQKYRRLQMPLPANFIDTSALTLNQLLLAAHGNPKTSPKALEIARTFSFGAPDEEIIELFNLPEDYDSDDDDDDDDDDNDDNDA